MFRALVLSLLACSAVYEQASAAETYRVLAELGQPIEGANFTPTAWLDSHLTHDGGAWLQALSPQEGGGCNLLNCPDPFPPPLPIQVAQLSPTGSALWSFKVGERSGGISLSNQQYQFSVDSRGQYGAYTTGTPATPTGLWTFGPDGAEPVQVAVADEQLFEEYMFAREIGVGQPGEVYYSAQFKLSQAITAEHDTGIWRVRNGETTNIAREGEPAPGVPGAVLGPIGSQPSLFFFGPPPPAATFASSRGGIAFRAEIDIPGFEFVQERGLWADRGEGLQLVTRTSLPAPGAGDGNVFAPETNAFSIQLAPPQAFSEPLITGSGDVYFAGNTRTGVRGWDGLWRSPANGNLEALVTVHDPVGAAAKPDDRVATLSAIDEFDTADFGYAAFSGALRLETVVQDEYGNENIELDEQQGVWVISPDAGVTLVAMSQNPPDNGEPRTDLHSPHVNAAGQVLFRSFTYGGEDPIETLTATGRNGELVDLLKTGDFINVGDDANPDWRMVNGFQFQDFDDAGRVLLQTSFVGSSSKLIVSDAVAAPSIFGDYNGDGLTDAADYGVWQSTFGATVRVGDGADGNLNGVIDAGDYTFWRDRFVVAGAAGLAAAVPEPAALALLLTAASLGRRGRRRCIRR